MDLPPRLLSRRNPLLGVLLAATLFELSEGALRFLVPLTLDGRGHGPPEVGLVMFAFSVTSLLSRGLAAAVFRPDRARLLIVTAGLASSGAYLLTPFAGDLAAFTVLLALDGFGWGVAGTCLLAMIMVGTPRAIPAAVAMGWYIGFQGIAFALATTVGGVLGELVGVEPAMLVLATLPVGAASLVALRLPPVARAIERPADPIAPVRFGRLGLALSRSAALPGAVWAAALVAVYLNVMNGLVQSFFPLLGLALGLSVAQIGTLSSVRSGISAIARFGAGWLFTRVSPRRLHVPLLTLSAATIALLPSAAGFLLSLPLFALNGVSRGLLRVATTTTAMEVTRGHQAGAAAAVMTAGLDVGKMLGPLVGGIVAGAFGLELMFRVVPFGFLAAYLAVALLAGRRSGAPPAEPGSVRQPALDPTI